MNSMMNDDDAQVLSAGDCSTRPGQAILPAAPPAELATQLYQHIQRAKPYIPLLSAVAIAVLQVDEIKHLVDPSLFGPLVQCDNCWGGGGGGRGW